MVLGLATRPHCHGIRGHIAQWIVVSRRLLQHIGQSACRSDSESCVFLWQILNVMAGAASRTCSKVLKVLQGGADEELW